MKLTMSRCCWYRELYLQLEKDASSIRLAMINAMFSNISEL